MTAQENQSSVNTSPTEVSFHRWSDMPKEKVTDQISRRLVTGQGMMRFVEWGIAAWAPARRRLPILVYERPAGGRLARAVGARAERYAALLRLSA